MDYQKRYREIDIARGIGILFVVLGHAIKQTQVQAVWIRILIYIIYSFHMPLFFLLSGFTAIRLLYMESGRERLSYIGKRAVHLLVPYFFIGALYIPVKLKLSAYTVKPFTTADIPKLFIGENPNTALWFLYVLFIMTAVTALFVNVDNYRPILYGSFAISVAGYWANISYRTPKYFFFFLLGFWVRLKFEDCKKAGIDDAMEGQGIMAAVVLLLDIAAIAFLYRTTIMVTMVLTTVSGIYLVFWVSTRFVYSWKGRMAKRAAWIFEALGKRSMDIYILHEPVVVILKLLFWSYLGLNYILCTIIFFVMGILLPLPLAAWIIRPLPPLRFLILGETKKRPAAGK